MRLHQRHRELPADDHQQGHHAASHHETHPPRPGEMRLRDRRDREIPGLRQRMGTFGQAVFAAHRPPFEQTRHLARRLPVVQAGAPDQVVPRVQSTALGQFEEIIESHRTVALAAGGKEPLLLLLGDHGDLNIQKFRLGQTSTSSQTATRPRIFKISLVQRPWQKSHFSLAKPGRPPSFAAPCHVSQEKQRPERLLQSVSR